MRSIAIATAVVLFVISAPLLADPPQSMSAPGTFVPIQPCQLLQPLPPNVPDVARQIDLRGSQCEHLIPANAVAWAIRVTEYPASRRSNAPPPTEMQEDQIVPAKVRQQEVVLEGYTTQRSDLHLPVTPNSAVELYGYYVPATTGAAGLPPSAAAAVSVPQQSPAPALPAASEPGPAVAVLSPRALGVSDRPKAPLTINDVVPAGYVQAGVFGSVLGGGNYSFPGLLGIFGAAVNTQASAMNVAQGQVNQLNITPTNDQNWGLLLGYGDGSYSGSYHGLHYAAIINVDAQPMFLGTSNTPWVKLDAAGKVGVGTMSPTHTLSVGSGFPVIPAAQTSFTAVFGDPSEARIGVAAGSGQALVLRGRTAQAGVNAYDYNTLQPLPLVLQEPGFGGNVGIGTNTPNPLARLVVTDSSSSHVENQLVVSAASDAQWGLVIGKNVQGSPENSYHGPDAAHIVNTAPGSLVLGTNNLARVTIDATGKVGIAQPRPAAALDVVGDINLTGNINAKYQDVAEWVPASESMRPGTVVVLDPGRPNQVMPSQHAYDTSVAGVVSAQPGVVLGEAAASKEKIATTGRVKVRVDASTSPIHIGDLLVTSDKSGMAMRSKPVEIGGIEMHRPGTLIGKALEPLDQGQGEILVLLSLQ